MWILNDDGTAAYNFERKRGISIEKSENGTRVIIKIDSDTCDAKYLEFMGLEPLEKGDYVLESAYNFETAKALLAEFVEKLNGR